MSDIRTGRKIKIEERVRLIVESDQSLEEKLQQICVQLAEEFDMFDWVGFYLVDPDAERELVLGPYVGESTEHTRIPFGKGICGQAANSGETFIVQDVSEENNYLACSPAVKAEIVVPIKKDGEVVGELDIDSHTKHSITDDHKKLLEEISDIVATLF